MGRYCDRDGTGGALLGPERDRWDVNAARMGQVRRHWDRDGQVGREWNRDVTGVTPLVPGRHRGTGQVRRQWDRDVTGGTSLGPGRDRWGVTGGWPSA